MIGVRRAWAVWATGVIVGGIIASAAFAHDPNPSGDAPETPTMADLAWIAGDWVSVSDDLAYTITETWSAPFHETMTGVARTVVMRADADGEGVPGRGEVVSTRAMIIRPRADGLPVLFMRRMTGVLEDYPGLGAAFYPLMEWSADSYTFENEGQQSPRTIRFERTGAGAIRITYTGVQPGTRQLQSQPTDFRARHAAPPADPLIARAMLFRALLKAEELDAARAMMGDDPRRWWGTREGEGNAWTIGPEGGPWHAWDAFFRARTEVVEWSSAPGSASLTFRETNDYFRLLERGWTTSRATYLFDDAGRITGMLIEPLGERPQGRSEAFVAWAREHHPEELEALMPGGEVDPSGDHPARMHALLDEWRVAAGLPALD